MSISRQSYTSASHLQGGFTLLNLFVIPLAPGRSRVISRFISTQDNIFFQCVLSLDWRPHFRPQTGCQSVD
jgi:hypothetical protein